MKVLGFGVLAVAALGAAASLACVSGAQTTVEHDEFTGETQVTAEARMPPGFHVAVTTGREASRTTGGSVIMTRTSTDGWQYLRCHSVAMIVDGQPWGHIDSEHDGDVGHAGSVVESITASVDPQQLYAIAKASEVRSRVCNDEWTWSPDMMAQLAEFRAALYVEE